MPDVRSGGEPSAGFFTNTEGVELFPLQPDKVSSPEKRRHARQLNLARRHLDRAAKRQLIADDLAETPARSSRHLQFGPAHNADGL